MATKKKTPKKSPKSKSKARKRATPMKPAKPPKKFARQKPKPKKAKKTVSAKKQTRKKSASRGAPGFSLAGPASRSGDQSGDLQGLSRPEAADSESVDELLAEGNAFEADAVLGVEDAGSGDPREVRTHEVPEDDVPSEYLDEK
jgi:outer membrane biosynthesis protein TonB